MPIDFPNSPTDGQVFNGWVYNLAKNAWQSSSPTTLADNSVSGTKLVDASVANGKLTNSSVTINGTSVALGGSATVYPPTLPASQSRDATTPNAGITATSWAALPSGYGLGTISLTLSAAAVVQVSYGAWMAVGATGTDVRAQVLYNGTSSNSAPFPNWGSVLFNNGVSVSSLQCFGSYVVQLAAGTYTFQMYAYKTGSGTANVNYATMQVTPLRWA